MPPASGGAKISGEALSTDKRARVRFRVSDVFLPIPEDLSHRPSTDTETEGVVVDFSDSGLEHHVFAVVELDNEQIMVVPVDKLKLATPGSSESGER